MSLGAPEILIIVVLVLVLFGPDKLPDLARSLGRGIREFRKITGEFQSHFDLADDDKPRRATSTSSSGSSASSGSIHETSKYETSKYESEYDTMHLPNVHGVAHDREADGGDNAHNVSSVESNSFPASSEGEAPSPNAAPHALNVEALRQLPRTPAPQTPQAPPEEDSAQGRQAADLI